VRGIGRTLLEVHRSTTGALLVEALIALAIFGVIAASFMGAVYTSRTATTVVNEQAVAESLTRIEMEYIKESPYWGLGFSYQLPGSPPPWDSMHFTLDDEYDGYAVSVTGTPIDASTHDALPGGLDQGMQEIEVQVFRGTSRLLTTNCVKVNR